ncbi:hypothetical protein [Flavobacterium ginsengiterrae]|uniref:Lipoprotein n=1 Tax=Flavobacterium ginsengiterrae TaxID=871695 RepID=A0ABP7GCZ2_9FLAO
MRFLKFIFFGLALCFSACSQNKKMSNLTSKNYIEIMSNNTKRYTYEPMYYLTYEQNICYSEILVNDIPVNKNFKEMVDGGTIRINNYIFKSGIQKVTVKLYAIDDNKDFDFSTFTDETDMKIDIEESDNVKRDLKGKEITSYVTPIVSFKNIDGYEKSKFEGSGKTYYEATFTFNVVVPYDFNSLDKARDLSKWDKEILKEKVVDFYKKQWNIINEKRVDDYFSFLELKEKETCQSEYSNKTELQENLEAYLLPFTNSTFKLEPIENYTVKLYGNGKLVSLELKSLEKIMRGKSVLWGKYKDEEAVRAKFRKYYLYIPEGENELKILR